MVKSVHLNQDGSVQVIEDKLPELEEGAVLVKTTYSEVCGTDVHLQKNQLTGVPYPIIPGHVSTGIIHDLSGEAVDVDGHWAEFNSPADVARFILGTKADTLARLEPHVQHSHIGKQLSFSSKQWTECAESILEEIIEVFDGAALVVRSSAKGEDSWEYSNAGGFESVLNIDGKNYTELCDAINSVITSYTESCGD